MAKVNERVFDSFSYSFVDRQVKLVVSKRDDDGNHAIIPWRNFRVDMSEGIVFVGMLVAKIAAKGNLDTHSLYDWALAQVI